MGLYRFTSEASTREFEHARDASGVSPQVSSKDYVGISREYYQNSGESDGPEDGICNGRWVVVLHPMVWAWKGEAAQKLSNNQG